MQVPGVMILSKHELWGVIMTQGRLESEERFSAAAAAAWVLKAAEPAPFICKQVMMSARCVSICTNEQGRGRGR